MSMMEDLVTAGLKSIVDGHGIKLRKTTDEESVPLSANQLFEFVSPYTLVLRAAPAPESPSTIFIKTLTGKTLTIKIQLDATIQHLKAMILDEEGIPMDQQRLILAGKQLSDFDTLNQHGVKNGSILHMVLRLRGGGCGVYYIDKQFFDPRFNFDFTKIRDTNKSFVRGGAQYVRPIGCQRYAIKIEGKYPDNEWIGCTGESGKEWPVAYHGTMESNCANILREGFDLEKCKRFAFGRGIYCTPDPLTARAYAKEYVFQGKSYHLIFQVRVNPQTKVVVREAKEHPKLSEYWLVPDGEHMRPYGICVYPA